MADPAQRRLDAASLPGLAHPLRVQLLEQLTHHGPGTATQLGERLGESSGATSYHLRQLERYGFVETCPDRGTGRERWWRRVEGRLTISTPEFADDPGTREAAALIVNEFQRGRRARHDHWWRTFEQWHREWQEASSESSTHLSLTAAETRELGEELNELLSAWKRRSTGRESPPDARSVEAQVTIFPLLTPDAGEE